jgi:hypothetical protein
MNTLLKGNLSIRTVILCTSAIFALVSIDFYANHQRAYQMESDLLPESLPNSVKSVNLHLMNILNMYAGFDNEKAKSLGLDESIDKPKFEIDLVEQNNQKGTLPKLYIGDKVYRLNALINRHQISAVLSVASIVESNLDSTLLTLQVGDSLGPYLVTELDNKRLELTAGNRVVWLALFTPKVLKHESEIEP